MESHINKKTRWTVNKRVCLKSNLYAFFYTFTFVNVSTSEYPYSQMRRRLIMKYYYQDVGVVGLLMQIRQHAFGSL